MPTLQELRERAARLSAQRRAREIAVAIVLTVAAVTFITVALLRGDPSHDNSAPFATARKGPSP